MNRIALRAAIATAAIAPMIALGAGVASAIPLVTPGPVGSPYDGTLEDFDNTVAYTCVLYGPGIGFGSNPVAGTGPVTGLFLGPGVVDGVCLIGTGGIATAHGFVA